METVSYKWSNKNQIIARLRNTRLLDLIKNNRGLSKVEDECTTSEIAELEVCLRLANNDFSYLKRIARLQS